MGCGDHCCEVCIPYFLSEKLSWAWVTTIYRLILGSGLKLVIGILGNARSSFPLDARRGKSSSARMTAFNHSAEFWGMKESPPH